MGNNIFSYTNRSLENSRQEGLSKIPIISRGDYTDLNATDPGMIILDYVHALVDMINYYQDHQALETFITTARERKNIFRLAKQLAYAITSSKGATVDLTFSLNRVYTQSIRIPVHTRVGTVKDIIFLTTEESYIEPGSLSVIVPAVQGEYYTESYTGTGISRYSNTARASDQEYTLSKNNIDIDTIEIVDSLNRVWTPVEYIVFSGPDDRVYQKELTYDGTVKLKFGNGQRGIVPGNTDTLYISYIHTLAEKGRVGSAMITQILDTLYDITGNDPVNAGIQVSVTNTESTIGGSGPSSDEEITMLAPGIIKSQDRAVTIKDFENLAKNVEGIAEAVAYDINNSPEGFCLYHEVKILVIPKLGTVVNNSLLKRVYDYLYQRMIPPTNLQVLSPIIKSVDITLNVVKLSGAVEGGIEYSIREAVNEYFDKRYGAVGLSFNPNELIAKLSSVQGVRYIGSITPSDEVTATLTEVIRLGELTVNIIN